MKDNSKREVRAQQGQLLTLLNGWDPAGLLAQGAPRDRYQWLVDKLLPFLSRTPSKEDVAAFLEREIGQHFGVHVEDAPQFATKLVAWFQMIPEDRR